MPAERQVLPNEPPPAFDLGISRGFRQCVGNPRELNASHSGVVNISISLQEPAVFLTSESEATSQIRRPPARATNRDETSQNHENYDLSTTGVGSPAATPPVTPDVHEQTPTYFEIGQEPQLPGRTRVSGSILIKVTRPTRIKEVGLELYGVSRTVWNLLPQASVLVDAPLPSSAEFEDVVYFTMHRWHFIPMDQYASAHLAIKKIHPDQSVLARATDLYGANTVIFKSDPEKVHQHKQMRTTASAGLIHGAPNTPVLSLAHGPSRKLRWAPLSQGGVLFPPGEYVYHFSFVMSSDLPESVQVPMGHVRYYLVPRVVRAGAFSPNVHGHLELPIIRSPAMDVDALYANPAVLSRVWDERLVYSITLAERALTMDVPSSLRLSLLPLPGGNATLYQIRVYLLEVVSYVYSPDKTVHNSDSSLRLILYRQNAPTTMENGKKVPTNLLHPTEPTHVTCELMVASKSDRPMDEIPQSYGRGLMDEQRFAQPDATGPYIRVKHRLIVTFRVSKLDDGDAKRHHFEVKVDTPITLLSTLCTPENVLLPSYNTDETLVSEEVVQPPTFDESRAHDVVGEPVRESLEYEKPRALED